MDTQMIHCPWCGAINRVPLSKLAQGLQANCGRCKKPLPQDGQPVTITDGTFRVSSRALAVAGAARYVGAMVRAVS